MNAIYVSYMTYHSLVGERCGLCAEPFKRRKRGRFIVSLQNEIEEDIFTAHEKCFSKIKQHIRHELHATCWCCACNIDIHDPSQYLPARVYFDDSHDDEVACRECILRETAASEADKQLETNIKIARGFKRMLETEYISDVPALKKMKSMNRNTRDLTRTMRATHNTEQRKEVYEQIEDYYEHYEGFMIAKCKKHMMDACIHEMMQKIWHPSNYERWKHLY